MKNTTASYGSRKRKSLLLLPLLLTPFLTLGFWALEGGKTLALKPTTASGLNLELPNPSLKKGALENKLDVYQQAEQDSAKRLAQRKSDPLYRIAFPTGTVTNVEQDTGLYNPAPPAGASTDAREEQVYRKLAALNQQLDIPTVSVPHHAIPQSKPAMLSEGPALGMEPPSPRPLLKTEAPSPDPELEQLGGLLDKIKEIQHPERTRETAGANRKAAGYLVSNQPLPLTISLLESASTSSDSTEGFLDISIPEKTQSVNVIRAVVHQRQRLTGGSVIKLRLLEPLTLNGVQIPEGTFIYGLTALNGERLTITIESIRWKQVLYQVHLEAYDLDGLPGIAVPSTRSNNTAWQQAGNSLQGLPMSALDPTLKTQAASAGIQAAKAFLTKKQRQAHADVKGGYQLLLKNNME